MPQVSDTRLANVTQAVILLIIAASLGFNVYWIRQLRASRTLIGPPPLGLKAGDTVAPIQGTDPEGNKRVLLFEKERGTLIYVFSPSCSWCRKNEQNLRELTARLYRTHQIVGVSLNPEGLAKYLHDARIEFPVYSNLSPETIRSYKLGPTPTLIMISKGTPQRGRVIDVWEGAWLGVTKEQIEQRLHIILPGVDRPQS